MNKVIHQITGQQLFNHLAKQYGNKEAEELLDATTEEDYLNLKELMLKGEL